MLFFDQDTRPWVATSLSSRRPIYVPECHILRTSDKSQERNNCWTCPRAASQMCAHSDASCISGCGFRQALERARSSEDGHVDPETRDTLETAIRELWRRIERDPSGYVLTRDEFALFNYFRDRYRDSTLAQNAVARFWNSVQSSSENGTKAKK